MIAFSSLTLVIFHGLLVLGLAKTIVPLQLKVYSRQEGFIEKQVEMFVGEISIGSPKQKKLVQIDTTSSDLWLFVEHKGAESSCETPSPRFDASRSSSFPLFGMRHPSAFRTTCYSATLSGHIYFETFKIGALVVNDFLFGGVEAVAPTPKAISPYEEDYYPVFAMDGVFGLGLSTWTSLNGPQRGGVPAPSPLFRMGELGLFGDRKLFSLYLQHGSHGELVLGGTNRRRAKGSPHYVPLLQTGPKERPFVTWSFAIDGIDVVFNGAKDGVLHSGTRSVGVLDSSSDMVYAPRSFTGKFVSRLMEGNYGVKYDTAHSMNIMPCGNRERLPSLVMEIGGSRDYVLHGTDYFRPSSMLKPKFCRLVIGPHRSSTWVLGLPFLRNYVTVFDYGKVRIGLAHVKKDADEHNKPKKRTKKKLVLLDPPTRELKTFPDTGNWTVTNS